MVPPQHVWRQIKTQDTLEGECNCSFNLIQMLMGQNCKRNIAVAYGFFKQADKFDWIIIGYCTN